MSYLLSVISAKRHSRIVMALTTVALSTVALNAVNLNVMEHILKWY